MRTCTQWLAVLAVLFLALSPLDAFAKAGSMGGGGGMSMGSRGSRTFQSIPSAPSAMPIQRSMTAPPSYQPTPSYAPTKPVYQQSGGWHPFWSGLAGGFLGGSLAHMMFGGFGYGYGGMGYSPVGSMFGGLLQLLLMFGIGYWIYKAFFKGRSGNFGGSFGQPMMMQQPTPMTAPMGNQGAPLSPSADNFNTFRTLLVNIQLAWGKADLAHLRQYVTPEILQYFNEALSNNSSRGLMNVIRDVAVVSCDLLEAWTEYELDYATVRLKWTAVDFMAHMDRDATAPDYVASGSSQRAEEAEEIWTFARAHGGGNWLLSAIQQVG